MAPSGSPQPVVLIPAYRPGHTLLETVAILVKRFTRIVVVDDGSGPEFRYQFTQLEQFRQVTILRHAANLGKGAALKTGINHILIDFPDCTGLVTADADGQHHPDDIREVSLQLEANPGALIVGVREFDASAPLRSRLGNLITRCLFHLIHAGGLRDTQCGLRGIPAQFAKRLLNLDTNAYDFELDMLVLARYSRVSIRQVPIRTIYIDGNRASHFNPLLDSMRIYFVMVRFAFASASTAIFDNVAFYFMFAAYGDAFIAQVVSRSLAFFLSYRLNRNFVFNIATSGRLIWVRFIAVVILSGGVSYAILHTLRAMFGWNVLIAKITAEGILFLFNFAILRNFVFTQAISGLESTDWTSYYRSVHPAARLTRRYTTRTIINALRRQNFRVSRSRILEFGGANSCFLNTFLACFSPAKYQIVDSNQYGLDLLKDRTTDGCELSLHNTDILAPSDDIAPEFDLVFSVGLVEHFDPRSTAEAVRMHFRYTIPGGLVLISFPRPTLLYRLTRAVLELTGLWRFPDERPLEPPEVLRAIEGHGEVIFQKTLWPLFLTQHLILARAKPS